MYDVSDNMTQPSKHNHNLIPNRVLGRRVITRQLRAHTGLWKLTDFLYCEPSALDVQGSEGILPHFEAP